MPVKASGFASVSVRCRGRARPQRPWTPGLRLRVTGSAREGRRRLFSGRSTGFACGALGNATAVKRREETIRPQWHVARQGAATTGRTRPPGRAWASGRRLETPARTRPGDTAGETQKADAGTSPRSRTAPSVRASERPGVRRASGRPSVRASAEAPRRQFHSGRGREAAPSPPCARAGVGTQGSLPVLLNARPLLRGPAFRKVAVPRVSDLHSLSLRDEREVMSEPAAGGEVAGRPRSPARGRRGQPLLPPALALPRTPRACPVTKTAGPGRRHTPRTVVCIRV